MNRENEWEEEQGLIVGELGRRMGVEGGGRGVSG